MDLGDVEKARRYAEMSLSISKDILGDCHPDTVLRTINCAQVLSHIHREQQALKLFDDLLDVLPKDHSEHGRIMEAKSKILAKPRKGFRNLPKQTHSSKKGKKK